MTKVTEIVTKMQSQTQVQSLCFHCFALNNIYHVMISHSWAHDREPLELTIFSLLFPTTSQSTGSFQPCRAFIPHVWYQCDSRNVLRGQSQILINAQVTLSWVPDQEMTEALRKGLWFYQGLLNCNQMLWAFTAVSCWDKGSCPNCVTDLLSVSWITSSPHRPQSPMQTTSGLG